MRRVVLAIMVFAFGLGAGGLLSAQDLKTQSTPPESTSKAAHPVTPGSEGAGAVLPTGAPAVEIETTSPSKAAPPTGEKKDADQAREDQQQKAALDAAHASMARLLEQAGPALVPTLTQTADALLAAAEPGEAIPIYQRSIALLREQRGVFDRSLIQPLTGLGKALQRLGKYQQALNNFKRAQHITHRSDGVMTLQQIPLLAEMIDSQKALHHPEKVSNLRRLAVRLYQYNVGKNSPEAVDAMRQLAQWVREQGDHRQARYLYIRVLKIQQRDTDGDTLEMIPTLVGMAQNYMESGKPFHSRALATYQRVVTLADAHPEFDPTQRILAHLSLGDGYIMAREIEAAAKQYLLAWRLSRSETSGHYHWDDYFNKTYPIETGPILIQATLIAEVRAKTRWYFDFTCRVTADGRPRHIRAKGTNLKSISRPAAIKAFRGQHFRPRLKDGVAVDTDGVQVRKTFKLVQSDYTVNPEFGRGF